MPRTLTPSRPVSRVPDGARHTSLLLLVAALSSLTVALGSLWLLAHPAENPIADPELMLARLVLSPTALTGLLVGLGVLGAVTALLLVGAGPESSGRRSLLLAVGAVEVAGMGLGAQSVSTISLAGYLLAMVLPLGLAWLAVQAIRHYRRLRWLVLAAVAAFAVWGAEIGALAPRHLGLLAAQLAGGFARHAPQLVTVLVSVIMATCWAVLFIRAASGTPAGEALGGWARRHRRGLTILAAAGPLPYGLIRSTWFTPWPLLVPTEEALSPETRLWGLLLGGAALLGATLTLGLIRPWGAVFPRWMPRLAGREVPVAAAVIPGGLVAGLLCAAAVPMLRMILVPEPGGVFGAESVLDRLSATLIFPFWLWGPALGLAVWGYARWRAEGPSGPSAAEE